MYISTLQSLEKGVSEFSACGFMSVLVSKMNIRVGHMQVNKYLRPISLH